MHLTPVENMLIRAGQGDYAVEFQRDAVTLMKELQNITTGIVLIDANVAEIYQEVFAPMIAGMPVLRVPATEEEKTLTGIARVLEFLQQHNATKQTTLIAIGGGIIQDIATISAHIYYRGLKWVYAPTTLLGMCDSCIGAKCGINLKSFKNQIGVFHAPSRVLICSAFLESLSDDDIRSGYGEILKLLLTGSRKQYALLAQALATGELRNPQLDTLIRESLLVKKRIIEEDEYEADLRRILNYGHTFGHSLEAITQHAIPHGMAVAWGVDLINFLSWKCGLLTEADFSDIHRLIETHFHFHLPHSITAQQIVQGAKRDKKVRDGQVSLILLAAPGDLRIVPTAFDNRLTEEVAAYMETYSVVHWD